MKKFLLLFILIIVLKVSVWPVPFVRDAFGYAYIGKAIGSGLIPYQQVWDHKPPGIFFLDGLIYRLFPSYILGIRFIGILFALFSAFFFYKLIREFFDKKSSFIATGLFAVFSNVYILTQGDNLVESYMIVFLLLLYYFFLQAIKTGKDKFFFMAGLALGVLFIFKQVGLLPLGAIVFHVLLQKRSALSKLVFIFLGFCFLLIPLVCYVLLTHSVSEALDGIFLYNFLYTRQGYSITSIGQSLFYFYQIVSGSYLFWFLALIGLLKKKYTQTDILFLLFLIFAFLGTVLGGKFAFSRNYFLLVLPSLGYFVAKAVSEIQQKFLQNSLQKKIIYGSFLFLLFPSFLIQLQVVLTGLYFQGIFDPGKRETQYALGQVNYTFIQDEKTYYTIAGYLQKHVQKNDYILNWGAEPEVYLLTNTYAPTRYFYNFPLNGVFIKDSLQEERRKTFLQEIIKNKPLYIITNGQEERYKPSFRDMRFPAFQKLIKEDYFLEQTIGNYLLFRLRSV